ncbi:MAG TPA: hypothetical protein VIP51_10080 [Eoetvoesiella sp.]
MSGTLKAALNVERTPAGEYEWVITAVDSTVGTMPQIQRSKQTYATEDEANRAGKIALEDFRLE